MSGGHLANFKKLFRLNIILALMLNGVTILAADMALRFYTPLDSVGILVSLAGFILVFALVQGYFVSRELTKPTEYLAQAIYHISPNEHLIEAPNVESLSFGRELVANLTRQIYDFAATSNALAPSSTSNTNLEMLDALPVSVIGLDDKNNIVLINKFAQSTYGLHDCIGLPLNSQVGLKFPDKSLDEWAIETKSKSINATNSWQKIELSSNNGEIRSYVDIAANFRQQHPSGIEKLVVLFDHKEIFQAEDDTLTLIALSIHEIRTPLTILKGYIEAVKDELEGKVDPKTKEYIDRLSVSSDTLTTFMTKVMNVVKADQNQLILQLQEANWKDTLKASIDSLQTRARTRGKEIKLAIANDLPTVALDAISINEVITNLIDNAIKYSPEDKKTIWVEAKLNSDRSILTTIRDEGVGIPDSVVPNLFTRFYRNRRNRLEISGTGLGLFISKEIISAHHGNIWVNSKEGAGTTVSFTLIPYTRLADVAKTADNNFTQVSHGWIKNHSMQRR